MIPLAQYFAAAGGDDFTPMAAAPARKPAPRPLAPAPSAALARKPAPPLRESALRESALRESALRESEGVTLLAKSASPVRREAAAPAAPAAPRPLDTVSPRVMTEPRIALRVVEAERAAWAAEREANAANLDEAVASAREDGIALGRRLAMDEAEAGIAARLDAQRADLVGVHGLDLATSRQAWTVEEGERLADLMVLQLAILEETIKVNLNNVLRPLALDARRRQTLEDLVGAVKTIALDGAAYKISASGPRDLLSALKTRLGDHAALLAFEADETQADIRIDADATIIESRLSSWQLALEEALS